MRWFVVMLLVSLAGCVSEDAPDVVPTEEPEAQYEDEDQNFTLLQPDALPREPPAAGERTFAEVPLWRLGEWWTYEIDAYLTGEQETITRIVAGSEHGNFLVGFPIDEFSNFALVLHHPGYGDIHRENIDYDHHDQPWKPMDFPLEEGKTWETSWMDGSVRNAVVTSIDNGTGEARIDYSQANGNAAGYAIYDRDMGVAKEFEFPGYGNFKVIDHGFDYDGAVRVPHDHDLTFFHGCLAGAQTIRPGNPITNPDPSGCPSGTIEMPEGYDRVSFGILAQDVAGASSQQVPAGGNYGYYSMTVTAPQGDSYTYEANPTTGGYFQGEFFEHENPGGTWTYDTVAAGPGLIFIEGIGYHSIDIDLPSGCVIASQNALHHVTLCKAD